MSRPMNPLLLRSLVPLAAVLLLGSPAMAAPPPNDTVALNDSSTRTSLNDWLITVPLVPAGSIDPTNVPVLSGDFKSLTASICPTEATKLRLTDALKLATGNGVIVAVLDSGWNLAAPALSGKLQSNGWDAFDADTNVNDSGNKIDDDADGVVDSGVGHGTFVASIIARCATGAKILPVRVANDEGRGTSLALGEGLRYAIEQGARVINVSFALDVSSPTVQYWLNVAEQRNVAVICAAGNDGVDMLQFLAKAATTLAVGAVDGVDKRAGFSNFGPAVDLYAPGVLVLSNLGAPLSKQLAKWSGTSFSTPFVSAAAAYMVQRHPTWTAAAIRSALKTSTDTAYPLSGEPMSGRINLQKAASK